MYDYTTVVNGLAEFIDTEILSKIDDWRKWVFGAGVGFYLSQGKDMFEQLKENNLVKKMNLIEKDKINVDLLYKEMKVQAAKSAIMFDIPTIGPLVINEDDLDKLYSIITK
jgi:hypothetical protein